MTIIICQEVEQTFGEGGVSIPINSDMDKL